jgi:hypothetical protein
VVNGVGDGSIIIRPGTTVPSLSDAETGQKIMGTGRGLAPDDPQQWSRMEFLRRAADDFPVAYASLLRAVTAGDMRAHQIFWGALIGRATEPRETKIPEFLKQALEASLQPQLTEGVFTVVDVEDAH